MTDWPPDVPRTDEIEDPQNLGTKSVADTETQFGSGDTFRDTFFGPRDKNYLDLLARRMTKLRGTNVYYYVLTSQTQRTDGGTPVSINPAVGPFDRRDHAGGHRGDDEARGVAAMYGEPVVLGPKINSYEREIQPTWDFKDPIPMRGVVTAPERSEDPDERGSIYIKRLRIAFARTLCEKIWEVVPQIGDMVRVPKLMNDYYDVEEVVRNESRFGSTGFFTHFDLQLARSSRHFPERKLPERQLTPTPEPPV